MPDTEAGRFIGMITCGFVIMIAPMIWYYLKYGCVVKGLTLWFLRPDRKPPDPKSHKQSMRRRRLKKFISLMETLPIIILASDGKIPKFGLTSYAQTADISCAHAERVRNLLRETNDIALLSSIQGAKAVCDSGASCIATNTMEDMVPGTYKSSPHSGQVMQGIAGGCTIQGRGQVRYEVVDHHGRTQVLEGDAILVEELPCRLIPPQKVMKNDDHGYFRINGTSAQLVFEDNKG